ncbi:MAG: tetracycline regulation of excision, RteC [Muricauda sp.]|nr:RteC domain-containing protein [uncultured Allomuricauda sp.]MBC71860.1 tetracycline regulation of excision, RteC [Allomuricauda sp.]|tara:strand:- start:311 stop:1153 length:843 start_codon:yes stop_codon:yes gene_type:complete
MIDDETLEKFDRTIDILEFEEVDILVRAEKGIKIIKEVLNKTRNSVVNRSFKSKQKEIHFFKVVKPKVFSKLIYYVKLFNIESKRPRGSNKSQIKYFNSHIERLQIYFNDNLEFYHYYRRNATSLDEQYFLRGKADIRLYPDTFHFFSDEQFSTSHDCTVATILAYDMLIVHLKTEIDKLENNNGMETAIPPFRKQSKLFWTGHKTDLIELIYALHSCGAINSGTADIKEMAAGCEQIFNIDLGNYYHTFIEIRSRKANNTKFIDKLKESLIKRFRELDE